MLVMLIMLTMLTVVILAIVMQNLSDISCMQGGVVRVVGVVAGLHKSEERVAVGGVQTKVSDQTWRTWWW